ncbi:hypothetical protein GQ600_1434 [Phytophthora cactorum]|nr:hypothetical protein GQ600_1434 [Phytophthora cactorum]
MATVWKQGIAYSGRPWGFNFRYGANTFNRRLDATKPCDLIQQPGAVIDLTTLVYHSVTCQGHLCTRSDGLSPGVWYFEPASYRSATRQASGSQRGSREAWLSTLSVFCIMKGRDRGENNYEEV